MPREKALAWFFGIAAGVACLHDHGIVHRDLKPGNIFSDEGIVKLGDYGLSKFISCSRRSGQTESVGTVHYMAPEIANGRYGKEIDVYALGIILFEMLTGRVPFEGESVGEVLMKHLTQPADVSALEEPYRSVVAKALEKDPAKRFSSVGEMLSALPRPVEPQVHVGPLPSAAGPQVASAGLGGASPAVPVAEAVEEEPILRAARQGARKAYQTWNESRINVPAKIIILVAILFGLATTMHAWFPFAFLAVFLYAFYWVARSIVMASSASRRPPAAGQPGTPFIPSAPPRPAVQPAPRPMPHAARPARIWQRRREMPMDALVIKSPRERTAELPAKFWEGSQGDPMLRRFILMVIGFGVGVFAFLVAGTLNVPLTPQINSPGPHYQLPPTFYAGDGRPMLMAFLAVFGTMFLIIRWWRLADPLRSTRMSLWAMAVTVLFAWLAGLLWMFPMPWLLMVACTMSVAIQLASPWVHPRVRRARAAQRREV
jgi:eukaryotic-like serine/threonine-protein kinase